LLHNSVARMPGNISCIGKSCQLVKVTLSINTPLWVMNQPRFHHKIAVCICEYRFIALLIQFY
jgi:hypothetical protein